MSARVTLYSRPQCHLCDDARAMVAGTCAELGEQWREVSVDADPELRARYGDEVPVVEVDGAVIGYWRIDSATLHSALA